MPGESRLESPQTRIQRIVDLSHPVDEMTQSYPGDPEPSFAPVATIADEGFNLLHVTMGSQSGTHVDAPYHFLEGGPRIDEMDLELFVGTAVVVDVTRKGPRERITWTDLAPVATALRPGRILVLHTGWDRHYGTPTYYEHPFLDADAARRVLEAGVRTIATDTINPDETVLDGPQPEGFPVHHLVAGVGGIIAENLTNIAAVTFPDPLLSLLPIRLTGADGAPVRAVAMQFASHE